MLYYIFIYFFIYAFIGWCLEVSYSALETGKWSNRGFLNGPLCPIYGVGVVVILILLLPISDYGPLLFAGGVILCSLIELVTGFVMEKVFHQRWWDYSTEPFNIGGYICLKFSLYWGLGVIFVVKLVHPTIAFFVEKVPYTLGLIILSILVAALIIDAIDTVRTMMGLNKQLAAIHNAAVVIHKVSDSISENLFEGTMKAIEEKEELEQKLQEDGEILKTRAEALASTLKRGQRRMLRAFPNMQSTIYQDDVTVMQHAVTEYEQKRDSKK
jgi:uncharacterized membrane protein